MQRIEGKRKMIIFPQEQLERLEKIKERHGITESEAVRKMVGLGLDIYEDYSYIGLPQLAEFTKRVKKQIRGMRAPKLV